MNATMTVEQMIQKYGLYEYKPGMVGSWSAEQLKKDKMVDELVARKDEVLAYLHAEAAAKVKAREERQAKIAAIEGLSEIRAALADMRQWRGEFNRSFDGEGGGGVGVRQKPSYDLQSMYARYPRAAAYLKAEETANSSNYKIAAIGKDALERILNGEDYTRVLADMEADKAEYVTQHMWD